MCHSWSERESECNKDTEIQIYFTFYITSLYILQIHIYTLQIHIQTHDTKMFIQRWRSPPFPSLRPLYVRLYERSYGQCVQVQTLADKFRQIDRAHWSVSKAVVNFWIGFASGSLVVYLYLGSIRINYILNIVTRQRNYVYSYKFKTLWERVWTLNVTYLPP